MPIAPNQLKCLAPQTKLLIQEMVKKPTKKKPNHPGYSGNFRSKWITGKDYKPSNLDIKACPF